MSTRTRRIVQALCVVGVGICLALVVRIGFVRSEYVGDTRCYPTLWQRSGRQICEASNGRRDLELAGWVALGGVLGAEVAWLHRRRTLDVR